MFSSLFYNSFFAEYTHQFDPQRIPFSFHAKPSHNRTTTASKIILSQLCPDPQVRRDIGHPAFVFNNAGTYEHKPFLSHTPDEIRRLVEVNLLGNLWVRPSAMMGVGSVLLLPYSKSCRWVSLFGIVACLS